MANRRVNINIVTTANTTGAQQATTAMTNLATASNAATTAATLTGNGASRLGQLAGQAGYQVQDFAVQVGAGTSALTAFAQQAPQLLGAFGPAGAIAGAIVAIGAISAKVFMSMGEDALSASEKAKKLEDKLDGVREAAEKAIQEKIDFGKQRIEDATTAAQQFADELNNATENQLALNLAVLESLRKVNEAEQTLNEVRGDSVDLFRQQSQQLAADAALREAEAKTLIAAEQEKLRAQTEALEIAKGSLQEKRMEREAAVTQLKNEEAALKIAQERLKTTQELAKESISTKIFGQLAASGQTVGTEKRLEAQRELESGKIQEEIERLKTNVKEISAAISATGELTEEVQEAQRDVQAVESTLRQTASDVQTVIANIDLNAVSEDISVTAEALKERSKLLADEVRAITEGVTASTPSEIKALEIIKGVLKDNEVRVNEITQTSSALAELGPRIREAINGNTQKVNQLLQIMQEMKTQTDQLGRRIDALQSRTPNTGPAR